MAIITISRQFASGGGDIAALVADDLGWSLVDRTLVNQVADRLGWPPEDVAALEERTETLIERLARTLSLAEPETFLAAGERPSGVPNPEAEIHRITQSVLEEVADSTNAVIVGRGGHAQFASRPDAFHAFVVAPVEERVRRAEERLGLSTRDAKRRIEATDQQRRDYIRERYRRTWGDPADYDLVLNSGRCSYDDCARVIGYAARRHLGL